MPMTTVAFRNERPDAFDVYVEPWPERFRLRPGEQLEFRYLAAPDGETVQVIAHDEGITLWTGIDSQPEFLIDGKPAHDRSWKD